MIPVWTDHRGSADKATRDGASGGPKAIDWKENEKPCTGISVLTEIDGFSVWCFNDLAQVCSSLAYFCG